MKRLKMKGGKMSRELRQFNQRVKVLSISFFQKMLNTRTAEGEPRAEMDNGGEDDAEERTTAKDSRMAGGKRRRKRRREGWEDKH